MTEKVLKETSYPRTTIIIEKGAGQSGNLLSQICDISVPCLDKATAILANPNFWDSS